MIPPVLQVIIPNVMPHELVIPPQVQFIIGNVISHLIQFTIPTAIPCDTTLNL